MPKFKVHGTFYTFVERVVEADHEEEAWDLSYGVGDWKEIGGDFELHKDMTEEINNG